jgi:hypothetical protein
MIDPDSLFFKAKKAASMGDGLGVIPEGLK